MGLAGVFCALVLPFLVGGRGGPVYAATYSVGADNRAAAVGLALLSLGVLVWAVLADGPGLRPLSSRWDFRGAEAPRFHLGGVSWRVMVVGAGLVGVWTAGLGWAVARAGLGSGVRFGESAYFLERMRDVGAFGGRLYTDFEWPYGPLLLMPPVWAHRLGVSLVGADFAWLVVLNVVGVLLAGYVLNRLPLGYGVRVGLFAMFCFEQVHPLAGANYSLGKFMLPFAVVVWGAGLLPGWRRFGGLAGGMLSTMLVSPELGVGLAVGIVGWAGVTAWQEKRWAVLEYGLAPVVGVAGFLAMYGRGFVDRLGHAAGGALNLVIEPLPDVLVLVVAVVWLAPRAVGFAVRAAAVEDVPQRLKPQAGAAGYGTAEAVPLSGNDGALRGGSGAVLTGVFLVSLGMLPGALGRADPLHVFFNGFGFLVLGFVGLRGRARLAWGLAVGLLALQVQVTNFAIYRPMLKGLVHPVIEPKLDVARLREETGGAAVAVPALFAMPVTDELALRDAGLFVADKVPGLAETWTPEDEAAKIARMRAVGWALVPAVDYTQAEGSPNASGVKRMLRLGYRYKERREAYVVGVMLRGELARDWVAVDEFGGEVLYRLVR